MKLEICSFSGYKIYPGRGKVYVRVDSRTFRFLNGKIESLFLQRKNPRKIHWTQVFRKMHKKGITEEVAKKRTRRTVKYNRAIVGASWDQIKAMRNQASSERAEQRKAAIEKAKAEKKAAEAKKAATRKEQPKAQQQKVAQKVKSSAQAPRKGQASSRR